MSRHLITPGGCIPAREPHRRSINESVFRRKLVLSHISTGYERGPAAESFMCERELCMCIREKNEMRLSSMIVRTHCQRVSSFAREQTTVAPHPLHTKEKGPSNGRLARKCDVKECVDYIAYLYVYFKGFCEGI